MEYGLYLEATKYNNRFLQMYSLKENYPLTLIKVFVQNSLYLSLSTRNAGIPTGSSNPDVFKMMIIMIMNIDNDNTVS